MPKNVIPGSFEFWTCDPPAFKPDWRRWLCAASTTKASSSYGCG